MPLSGADGQSSQASLPEKYSTFFTALEAMEKVPTREQLLHKEHKLKVGHVLDLKGKVLLSKFNKRTVYV